MNENQRSLARHALGLPNQFRKSYRNHFVTGEGSTDYDEWQAMVMNGDAIMRPGSELTGGDDLFMLTTTGAEKALDKGEKLDPERFK